MHWLKKLPPRFKKPGLRKVWALAGIMAALLSGVLGCEEDDLVFGHTFEDVQGVVLDSLTLQPIDSVTITFLDTTATSTPHFTDTLGAFKFGIAGNQSPLFFRKTG